MTTVNDWLEAVTRQLDDPARARTELDELDAALREAAEEMGEAEACEAFGDPSAKAREINHALGPIDPLPASSRIIGTPIGLDPRTAPQRLASLFDPADPRILVPKVMGIGWTINLGAVAVRMGLLEPDHVDADVLDSIPPATMLRARLASTLPLVIAAAIFPFGLGQERLPTHWPLFGPPDGWVTPGSGQLPLGFLAAAALLLAWAPARVHLSTLWHLMLIVGATNLGLCCLMLMSMQVFGQDRAIGWLPLVLLPACFVLTLLQAVLVVRAGARAAARAHTQSAKTLRS